MNSLVSSLLVAGLIVFGLSAERMLDAPVETDLAATATPAPAASAETLNEVVDQYCVRCHSDRRLTGNLTLEEFDVTAPERSAEIAERIVHKLRAGMMPPTGSSRPAGISSVAGTAPRSATSVTASGASGAHSESSSA